MTAPNLTFSVSGKKVSGISGKDFITVTFSADEAVEKSNYTAYYDIV